MYWVTGVILLIYLVVVYVLGRLLPLHGSDVWIMRGVLALLGLIGAAVALLYQSFRARSGIARRAGISRQRGVVHVHRQSLVYAASDLR